MTSTGHTADAAARRRDAVLAGHRSEEAVARGLLSDADPGVRAAALGALGRMGRRTPADLRTALTDGEPAVRRRACELAVAVPGVDLVPLLSDADPSVVEVAAWGLGERGPQAGESAVLELARLATDHEDALCREAAVAALGAVGDPAGLPAVLAATGDRPAVRRRAIIALAPFEGQEVDEALRRALQDRDRQVRQAAEDLLEEPGPSSRGQESRD